MKRRGVPGRWSLAAIVAVGFVIGVCLLGPRGIESAPTRGGKVVFAARQDIYSLDPQMAKWGSERKILLQFTDTLVVIKPEDGKVYPGLAESWDIAPDGKSFIFRLRKNVKFHDGTPLDANAVKFTFDRIQEPASAGTVARALMAQYEGCDVIDSHSVRVRFKQRYGAFLSLVSLTPLAPVSPTAVKKLGAEFGSRPVTTGPFMVKEWVPKSHVTMVRNPDYNWASPIRKHQGPAYIDEVVWRIVPETATRTAVLETGEVTIAEDLAYADVARLQKNASLRTLRGVPAGTPWLIFPNFQRFPTSELAVREALHYVVNKPAIAKTVFQGQSDPAWSALQPTTPSFIPASQEAFAHNPAKAKKVLEDAGWKPGPDGIRVKDGKRLELSWPVGTGGGFEEIAPLVQAMAREAGIDIQLREMTRAQLNEAQMRGEHHIGEVIWFYPDPSILTTLFHSAGLTTFNKARLSDPEMDKMLEQAATTVDERQRLELYRKLQRTLSDMVATVPIVNQVTIVGTRKELQNYQFNVVTFPVLYDVYLEK